MKKSIIKSITGSFLIATGINLFMIPEYDKAIQEYCVLTTIKTVFAVELFLMIVILLFWFGLVLFVKAIEGWCE